MTPILRNCVAVVALALAMLAGWPSAMGTAAVGSEAPIESIPWSQVGAGWTLATWSPVAGTRPGTQPAPGEPTRQTAATTLYLVDPAGVRYPITTFPPPGEGSSPDLVDWSGDGKRALFETQDKQSTTMIEVDLTTGAQRSFTVAGRVVGAYSRPTGQAVVVSASGAGDAPSALRRVDLTGAEQFTYPTDQLGSAGKYNGGYLASPDGTQLVLGTSTGMVLMGNDGVLGRALPMSGPANNCSPVRWWTSTVILARCSDGRSGAQLWRVPVDGGNPTAVTAFNSGNDPAFQQDYGDVNAWQLPSGTFVQTLGACGTVHLSRLTADLHTTIVDVPGVGSGKSIFVKGITGDKLVLQATMGCGSGVSLLTYDPAANTSTVLLGPPINDGGVIDAVPYPGQK